MRMMRRALQAIMMTAIIWGGPAAAQWGGAGRNGGSGINTDTAIAAAILSDVSRDRQAEREARRQPYASPGYGPISNAREAAGACATNLVQSYDMKARVIGDPLARTMATGWEVQGNVDMDDGHGAQPFVCSVRNGSVSAVKLGN